MRHHDPQLQTTSDQIKDSLSQPDGETVLNDGYRQLKEEAYHIGIGYINIPWGVSPRIATWEPYPVAEYASALHTITLK